MGVSRVLHVEGGTPLKGELRVYPAKNAALPILAASLLTPEPITLVEVPRLRDVEVMLELLAHLGTQYAWEGRTLHLQTPEIKSTHAPYELVGQMRASFIVWGALLARAGEGHVSMPGDAPSASAPWTNTSRPRGPGGGGLGGGRHLPRPQDPPPLGAGGL